MSRKKKFSGVLLLSIGDELLDGRTVNSNAQWMGEQLRLSGIPVTEVRVISDRTKEICAALKYGSLFPVVVTTGGLGPTNDDRTMEAAAKTFRQPLQKTKSSIQHVKKRYQARGLPLTESRLRLALIPQKAKIISNPVGSAPGVTYEEKNTSFFFLPGPPNECHPMFHKSVLPTIKKKVRAKKLVRREFWRTFGRGESDVYQKISSIVDPLEKKYGESFTFGVHISFPYIDLTLEVWRLEKEKTPSTKEISTAILAINEQVAPFCFTNKRESMAETVFALLKDNKKTLSLAESCTGGLVSKALTDLSGSSTVFLGGIVSYANSAKEILLGVKKETLQKFGAVSEQCVREMAENIRIKLGTDYALALSGISGPTGGTEEKPVGTIYVALSSAKETKILHQVILHSQASRDQNRILSMHLALNALRSEILDSHANRFPLSSNTAPRV